MVLRKVTPSFPPTDAQHWNGDDINNLVDMLQGNSTDKIAQTAIDAVTNGGLVTVTGLQTLTNKTLSAPSIAGAIMTTFTDIARITIPANPATNFGRMYVKQIDANNDGIYILIKKAGVFSEQLIK